MAEEHSAEEQDMPLAMAEEHSAEEQATSALSSLEGPSSVSKQTDALTLTAETNEADDEQQDIEKDNDDDSNQDDHPDKDEDSKDHDSSSQEDESTGGGEPILGGEIDTPAFALLTGTFEDPKEPSEKKTISIPLTRLPATLGRSHDTNDRNFFGLGNRKALSREQCRIYYRDAFGGRIGQYEKKSDDLVYRPPSAKFKQEVIRPNKDEPLPSSGFFVVECVGKNRFMVGGERVEPGEVALLKHGTPIRMNNYYLYFALPTIDEGDVKTLEVPNPSYKKRKPPSTTTRPAKRTKGAAGGGMSGLAAELEAMSAEQLQAQMTEAIESNQWDRRHQMVGTAISVHAVKDAAHAQPIRDMAKKNGDGAVSRSDIMTWIRDSDKYSTWVNQMLSKMEIKSYQSSVSKALIKSGFVRIGTTGRHVKWVIPDYKDEGSQEDEDASDEESGGDESGDRGGDGKEMKESDEESDSDERSKGADKGAVEESGSEMEVKAAPPEKNKMLVIDSSSDDDDDDETSL